MDDAKEKIKARIAKRLALNKSLKQMIIDKLNLNLTPDQIEDDAPLFGAGLGLDSIDALELAVGVEEKFGVSINSDQLEVFRSINTLADYIESQTEAQHD